MAPPRTSSDAIRDAVDRFCARIEPADDITIVAIARERGVGVMPSDAVIVLDGGLATELEARGHDLLTGSGRPACC